MCGAGSGVPIPSPEATSFPDLHMSSNFEAFQTLHFGAVMEASLHRHYTGMVDKSLAFGDWTHSPAPLSSQEVVWWDWKLQPSNQGWFPSNQLHPQGLPKSHPINTKVWLKVVSKNKRHFYHSYHLGNLKGFRSRKGYIDMFIHTVINTDKQEIKCQT